MLNLPGLKIIFMAANNVFVINKKKTTKKNKKQNIWISRYINGAPQCSVLGFIPCLLFTNCILSLTLEWCILNTFYDDVIINASADDVELSKHKFYTGHLWIQSPDGIQISVP